MAIELVGAVGVEPTTNGLKGRCSATELRPWKMVTTFYTKQTDCTCAGWGATRENPPVSWVLPPLPVTSVTGRPAHTALPAFLAARRGAWVCAYKTL